MRLLTAGVALILMLGGCAAPTPQDPDHPTGALVGDPGVDFGVPWPKIGDKLGYNFTFTQGDGGPSFSGFTELTVIGRTTVEDGYGNSRPALHIRQSNPDGSFAENYYIDAKSFRQLKLDRADSYNETANLVSPAPFPPSKHSYANATGLLERYAYDPFFEDANMFGVFATGRGILDDVPFQVFGNMWQRNGTSLLMGGSVDANMSKPTAHARWGELRTLDFSVAYDQGETYFENIEWSGDFAKTVPFAVRADRTIRANFFGDEIDVRFLLELTEYTPGTGEQLTRQDGATMPTGPAGARENAPRYPVDGTGPELMFPLSEAIMVLERDPTAVQFFQAHTGAYLYYGEMIDVDTCGFYPAPEPPGCHWVQWYGIFFAPDDWMLSFWVEKYANADGTGASYTPVLPRDSAFTTLFDTMGGNPQPDPEVGVIAENSGVDLGERSAYPADALTIAGAIELWQNGASDANAGQVANEFEVHLTAQGYEFSVSNLHWEFPPENPEFFAMYDNMPMELLVHSASIEADGFVVEHRNYDVAIEHR